MTIPFLTTSALVPVGTTMTLTDDESSINCSSQNSLIETTKYIIPSTLSANNHADRNTLIETTSSTVTTTIASTTLNSKLSDMVYEKYATSYIESMSDEELESALQELDLLENKIKENKTNKL